MALDLSGTRTGTSQTAGGRKACGFFFFVFFVAPDFLLLVVSDITAGKWIC